MKNILVVCALSAELNEIKQILKDAKFRDIKISFFTVWIGNYNTILNLTRFLENNSFDFVVNIWICWYKDKKIEAKLSAFKIVFLFTKNPQKIK